MKRFLKQLIPPFAISIYHKLFFSKESNSNWENRYTGNYATWDKAVQKTSGYASADILDKVKEAALKVKNGQALFERDSVLFYKAEHNWPLLANFLKIAKTAHGTLKIVDFGGALGSVYFQNRVFLSEVVKIDWRVIEQKHFVNCGKQFLESDELKFYETIDQALEMDKPTVILISGTIQYLPFPIEFIKKIITYHFDYIIFDRTTFIRSSEDRLTIQHVPEIIYKASYPAWFFNREKFLSHFESNYNLISEFDSYPGLTIDLENNRGAYKGLTLKRKENEAI